MPADGAVTLPELIALIAERRGVAAVCAAAAAALVLAALLSGPALYRAEARLAIERGRLEVSFAANPAFEGEDPVLVYTQRDLLLSSVVLAKALDSGALAGSAVADAAEDPVAALRRRLAVVVSRDSRVLAVQLTAEDPRRAEAGLGAVIDAFLAEQSRRAGERSRRAVELLDQQVGDARAALDRARAAEEDWKVRNRLFQDDAERSFSTQRLTTLQGKLVVMREQIAALDTLLTRLDGAAASSDPRMLTAIEAVARNPVVLEVQKQLIEMENRRDALAGRYLEKHPRLVEMEAQVASKRAQLATAAGQVVRGLHAERDKLAAQLAELEQHIGREEAELNRYQQALVALAGLSERARSLQGLYDQLLRRLGEESVASRLDRTEAVLVDPPRAAARTVSWSPAAALPLALLVGLVAGIAGAAGAQVLDPHARGPAGLARAAELPILGRLREMLPPDDPVSAALEPARQLRDALLTRHRADGCRVWLSAGVGGGGTVAAQVAAAFAAAGARTLLVDADLRHPGLAAALGGGATRGLDGILAGEPDIAPATTRLANLDAIQGAQPAANAAELLHSHCLPEWLAHLRSSYDHVVIAAADLDAASDALLLAPHADAVLLTARTGAANARIRAAAGLLRPLGERLLGAVWVAA